jgi:hypothetical protein
MMVSDIRAKYFDLSLYIELGYAIDSGSDIKCFLEKDEVVLFVDGDSFPVSYISYEQTEYTPMPLKMITDSQGNISYSTGFVDLKHVTTASAKLTYFDHDKAWCYLQTLEVSETRYELDVEVIEEDDL